jgi:hypothetical protein
MEFLTQFSVLEQSAVILRSLYPLSRRKTRQHHPVSQLEREKEEMISVSPIAQRYFRATIAPQNDIITIHKLAAKAQPLLQILSL